jgi:hypothetical protein
VSSISGFRKEELKVLYKTRRKLKVTGQRQANGVPKLKVTGERQADGGQWARFLKVFPVPRSCDAGTIQAKLNTESAQLFVILPKGSASSKDKQKEHHPERSQSLQELMRADTADDASSGSGGGGMWSAQEDPGNGKAEDKEQKQDHQAMEEPRQDQVMNIQDLPRGNGDATENAIKNGDADGDDKGEDRRWWRKIRDLHALGFVLVLALVGVGATILYIVLL